METDAITHWAAKWRDAPGYYAIGTNMDDAEECRREGAEIIHTTHNDAVAGHYAYLDRPRTQEPRA